MNLTSQYSPCLSRLCVCVCVCVCTMQISNKGASLNTGWLFLDACVTVGFIMCVCPHGTNRLSLDGFSLNLMWEIFRKSIEKIRVSLISDKNNRYFT
jgi:hypothetical protein